MSETKWTPAQRAAIYDRGGALLVSAAAGSGKTAVLTERAVQLITDPEHPVDADELLIVTFTNAAAAEMRSRLSVRLRQILAADPGNANAKRQLSLLSGADICTIDAFCLKLVRENFFSLNLAADFRLLDENENDRLFEEAIDTVLTEFYEEANPDFLHLTEAFTTPDKDRDLFGLIKELMRFMNAQAFPFDWLEQAVAAYDPAVPLMDSPWYPVLKRQVEEMLETAAALVKQSAGQLPPEPAYDKYAEMLADDRQLIAHLQSLLHSGWDAFMKQGFPVAFANMPRVRKDIDPEIKAALAANRDIYKTIITKDIKTFLVSDSADYAQDTADLYPIYRALLRVVQAVECLVREKKDELGGYAFSDIEHFAIDLLMEKAADGTVQATALGRQLQGRYAEILVDEYQDTNEVQDCIFQAISREGRNLFTVGDVKQSIYRFRLADPTIFLEKYRRFADAAEAADGQPRRMVLSRNFRSRREVLTATNFVFGDIMSREMGEMDYTADEQLYFGADYYAEAADRETEMHVISVEDTPEQRFDRTEAEARFAARRIRQLLDEEFPVQGENGMRPVRPEDIVILMRSPRSRMKAFTAALAREGIPCGGGESDDFFSTMEIAVTVSLLEIVDNPRQDVPLISVLRSPLVGLCPDELAAIRALQAEGDYYDALCRDEGPAVREFLALLEELRRAAREMAVDELLWYIYDRCRVMAIFGAMDDGALRQARLTALYDYARQLVQSGKAGLFDFITHLRRLLEKGDAPGLSAARSAEGVQIMSVHGSKGLEFPVVILADLQRSFNQQDMSRPVLVHPTLGLGTERVDMERHIRYKTISKTALALRLEREAKAEEMRILYVAMTRAKEKLILIDCRRHMDKKLRELAVLTGSPVMPEAVAAAKSPGEWLLLSLLHTHEAAPLHALAGIRPETLTPIPEGWAIRLWREGGQETQAQPLPAAEEREVRPYTQPDEAALAFAYPYQAVTAVPTKITATQLKGRELDQEIAEGAGTVQRPAAPEKPLFLQEKRGLSAAERGTAIHLVMQYLPLDTAPTAEAVTAQVQALEQRRLLMAAQAEAVDAEAIAAFLRSPLAARIRNAEKVWREYRFALLMPAERYAMGAEGEEMLLQGVADCVFEEDGALTVVDFKTDRVTEEETLQRAELYRSQLQAYSDALSRIMEKPVSQRVLYFFRSGTEISL